jgi:hypothetical protein
VVGGHTLEVFVDTVMRTAGLKRDEIIDWRKPHYEDHTLSSSKNILVIRMIKSNRIRLTEHADIHMRGVVHTDSLLFDSFKL